jgi:hypothetical protein
MFYSSVQRQSRYSVLKKLLFVKLKHAVQFAVQTSLWSKTNEAHPLAKKETKGAFLSTPFLSQRLLITK